MPERDEDEREGSIPIDVVPQGWERAQTREGIPYYLNHTNQRTQWEHPVMKELFKELKSMNVIRSCFGAYRVASKIRTLQVITNLHKIEGEMVWSTLTDLGLHDQINESLYVEEVENLLAKLFAYKEDNMTTEEIESSTEITLSWVLKCYDSGRTGRILLRPLMAGLFVMTNSSPVRKYKNLFKVYSTNTGTMNDEKLSLLLKDMLMIIECIDEQGVFSNDDIPGSIASFRSIFPSNSGDIHEVMFVAWMKREPQLLTWLPTLHRFVTAETVKHEAKCAVCKAYPIVGFRYRCLKCVNTDLCQNCYWTKMGTRTHKETHPTREYCMATTTTDDIKDFGSQLRNKITKRYRRKTSKTSFLKLSETPVEQVHRIESQAFSNDLHGRIATLVSRLPSGEVEIEADYDLLRHDYDEQERRIQILEQENQALTHRLAVTSVAHREAGTMTPPVVYSHVPDMMEAPVVHRQQLPSSTPMTGLSLITLDEWSLRSTGNEEDTLSELTSRLVSAIPNSPDAAAVNAIITSVSGGDTDLLDATRQVDVAFAALLYEFTRRQ